jgi:hypothetical protein
MLFSTSEEFIEYIPASKNILFAAYKPMINTAELDDIIPFLSQEQYDDLNSTYNNGEGVHSLSESQKDLLHRVRRPLANIALVRYSAFGNLSIGNSGFTISTPDNTAVASQWRVEDLKRECTKEYFQGIERMLQFLEANTGLYSLWAESSSFTQFKECFINTADEFNSYFFINNSRRTFLSLKPVMKLKEEVISGITGQALFDQIKDQILNDTLSAPNSALLKLIKPAVVYHTMVEALPHMQLVYTENGPQLIESSNSLTQVVAKSVDSQKLERILISCRENAASKSKDLQDYLYLNHAIYPLFEADSTVYKPTASDSYNDPDNSTFGFGI